MSIFDGKRLTNDTMQYDMRRVREGWYADKYFANITRMLHTLAQQGYRFAGSAPRLTAQGGTPAGVDTGNLEVEMQWFTRRKPTSLVVGVDAALAMLAGATGYTAEDGSFVNTSDQLAVEALHDGMLADYGGDSRHVSPVLKVRGRYRDFAMLETPTLGVLSRATRVATNTYEVLKAARGKSVLFFPARFDVPDVQALDGYAYHIAVQRYNQDFGARLPSAVSTDAQGSWWGGTGSGTLAHAAIAAFLGDTAATMLAFAENLPPEVLRVALVDFNNDCVGDSLAAMDALFTRYRALVDAGNAQEARRYKLNGVRPDTSSALRDVSVPDTGDPRRDNGVNPRLIFRLREAVDNAWRRWNLPPEWEERAQQWCREVKIVGTGGFNVERISQFEEQGVPIDIYGVGSSLFSNSDELGTNNDFTADVVRVRVNGIWYAMAKTGRQANDNAHLERVELAALRPTMRESAYELAVGAAV